MTEQLHPNQGEPPPAAAAAAGEGAELVKWLMGHAAHADQALGSPIDAAMFTRVAELLALQQPQPVPMIERPWDRDGWCDGQGRCWIYINSDDGWHIPCWKLARPSEYDWKAVRRGELCFSLPANALPLPSRETPGNKGSESPLSEFGPNDMPLG